MSTAFACISTLATVGLLAYGSIGLARQQDQIDARDSQATVLNAAAARDLPALPAAGPTAQDTTTALFVGDSYSLLGFPQTVSAEMGWTCLLDGQGGTGYIATKPGISSSLPYIDRLPMDLERFSGNPKYVIVTGGRNDSSNPKAGQAALAYFKAVKRQYPSSQLIVVLPFWHSLKASKNITHMRDELRRYAKQVDAPTIETTDWLDSSLIGSDKVHPNSEGTAEIASRLVDALKKIVGAPASSR